MKQSKNFTVYHGSYCEIQFPNLDFAKNGKDFGKGFYVTTDLSQATKFAKIQAVRHNTSKGYISSFCVKDLNVLKKYEFENADEEWLNCVVGNRDSKYAKLAQPWKHYDVLIGKIADDDTSLIINAYLMGVYGKVGSPQAIKSAIKYFLPEKLKNQICFKTERALAELSYIETREVTL